MVTAEHGRRAKMVFVSLTPVAVSLGIVLAYVGFWSWFGLVGPLFGVPSTVYVFGVVALTQLGRAASMSSRMRQVGAIGVVIGFILTVVGLGPVASCPDVGGCTSGFSPNFLLMPGFLLMTISVSLDLGVSLKPVLEG